MSNAANGMSLHVVEGMLGVFPDLASKPGFAEAVMIGLATIRGLAMSNLGTSDSADALWAVARPQLLAMFESSPLGSATVGADSNRADRLEREEG
jgi:hypothetical protein